MKTTQSTERRRLHNLWATGKATRKQVLRCMDLDALYNSRANKKCGGWPKCACVLQGRESDCQQGGA